MTERRSVNLQSLPPMRALIHELPYERPLASGRYVYSEDGAATGALETWRLTAALEGYRFLRVDLDARTASRDSALYHLILDEAGRCERLKFRFFRPGLQIVGDVLFAAETAILTREVNGERFESQCPFPAQALFWFPASAGLSLLTGVPLGTPRPALTLRQAEQFALWPVTLSASEGAAQTLVIMGQSISTRPLTVRWEDEERMMWLDEYNWPVRVQRRGLTATETRYLRYA